MDKKEIKEKVLQALKKEPYISEIKSVAIFGSYLTGEEREDSDIDLLVEFEPSATIGFFKYVQIQRRLSDALGKAVDLLTPQAISKYIKPQILRDAEVIYEG
jgi:predicted nucleotidyltransferase